MQPFQHDELIRGNTERIGLARCANGRRGKSRTELAEMMVEVFVHQNRPFVRRQWPEESMGMMATWKVRW